MFFFLPTLVVVSCDNNDINNMLVSTKWRSADYGALVQFHEKKMDIFRFNDSGDSFCIYKRTSRYSLKGDKLTVVHTFPDTREVKESLIRFSNDTLYTTIIDRDNPDDPFPETYSYVRYEFEISESSICLTEPSESE